MAKNFAYKLYGALGLASLSFSLSLLLSTNTWAQSSSDRDVSDYIQRFGSDDWRVYQDAYRDLTRIGTPAIPALIEALKDENVQVRVYAADVLAAMGSTAKEAVPALAEALKDEDPYVRASAGEAIEAIGPDAIEALPALIEALKDESAYVRYIAADAIDEMGTKGKDAVPALIQTLQDEDPYVRYSAADALGEIGVGAKEAVPALRKALKDPDGYVRYGAASALGAIGVEAKPAIPSLIAILKSDENEYARAGSASALGKIGLNAKTTVPALTEALNDKAERVRVSAAKALGKIGCKARSALPYLIESLSEAEAERSSAASGLAGIAGHCQDTATQLSNSQIEQLVSDFEAALKVLEDSKTQATEEEIVGLRRPLLALKAQKDSRFSTVISQWMVKNKFSSGLLIYLIVLPTLWGTILLVRPLWLLRINDALEPYSEFQLTGMMRGTKLSLRAILLLSFFTYKHRVLDAWVTYYIKVAQEEFKQKETVSDRDSYLPLPMTLDGKAIESLTNSDLQLKFSQKQAYFLIKGEGGSGKTSIACQIAQWAMAENKEERLCQHRMLPILIEEDLDIKTDSKKTEKKGEKPKSPFLDAIRGQLQDLTNEVKPISEELLERLLQEQRLLVIVDRFSEMSDATRGEIKPESPDFPVNSLIVTSRFEEKLGRVNKTTLEPQRVEGNLLSSFLEDYITKQEKRSLFSDMEFLDACRDLSLRVGERNVTVQLVKMYADMTIARKEGRIEGELANNLPALMLAYLNKLNNEVIAGKLDNRTVQKDAKIVAWECLKANYRSRAAKRAEAIAALGDKSEDRLKYLEDRLRLVQTIGLSHEQIRFTLEPLAEYLAALHVVDLYNHQEESWSEFLEKAASLRELPDPIDSFLLAVWDCCHANVTDAEVPELVIHKLGQLLGFIRPDEPVMESEPAPANAEIEDEPIDLAIANQRTESLPHEAIAAVPIEPLPDIAIANQTTEKLPIDAISHVPEASVVPNGAIALGLAATAIDIAVDVTEAGNSTLDSSEAIDEEP